MRHKAAILAVVLLMVSPAWAQRGGGGRGGGHGGFSGGGRGGGSGGGHGGGTASGSGGHAAAAPRGGAPVHVAAPQVAAAAHIAAAHSSGPSSTSAPRADSRGFTASHFVPPPDTPPRSAMQHLPVGTLRRRAASTPAASGVTLGSATATATPQQASPPTAPRASVAWTPTTARMMTANTPTRVTVAGAPTQTVRSSVVAPATAFSIRNPAFFGGRFFFRRSAVFIFIGDGFFFPPFFFDTFACDPFLVNPFCPFCATGRILKLNRPFVPRTFFFDEFFPRRFFPAFGTGVFLGGVPIAPETPEQAAEEEKPSEAGRFVEGAPVPGAEQPPTRPITLLLLKNGWMYGLTDYWIEDGRLHYLTNYGGENSVPLEQVDFDRTVQLNAERGVDFVLRPKPQSR